MTDIVFLYVTTGNPREARNIAETLISEKLAACVNIHGPMISVYRWDENIEQSEEIPLMIKTTRDLAETTAERIKALHSYETPCIAALPISAAGSNPAFLAWIEASTKS